MREKTLGSLFDGIGGFPLAGSRHGIKALWASEIAPFPINVTKTRFPNMFQYGDVTGISGYMMHLVDVITFGSPCTRLSVAGKHDGFDITFECFGDDDEAEKPHYKNEIRATDKYQYEYKETCPVCGKELTQTNESALFFHAIRIITEMRLSNESAEHIRPRFAVWENVPGAFSSNKGEDFRQVLEEIIRIAEPEAPDIHVPEKGWPTYGSFRDMDGRWSVAWRVLDAQHWGVPQRRRRIFLVADFRGNTAPEILFKRKGLSRHSQEGREAREGIAANAKRGTYPTIARSLTRRNDGSPCIDRGPEIVYDCRGNGDGSTVPTLTGDHQNRVTDYTSIAVRTANTGANGHGISDDVAHTLDKANGQAVCAGFNGYKSITGSIQYQEDTAATLEANMPGNVISVHQNASGEIRQGEVANTLNTNSNASGRNAPLIAQVNCQPSGISGTVSSKWAKGTGGPAGDEHYNLVIDETARPLSAQPQMRHRLDMDNVVMTVAGCDFRNDKENGDLCGTLQAKPSGGQSINCIHPVRIGYSVRRLTPLECERLQGYPDGWTDIEGASDSGRYKALGNSVAIPCVEFVLEGISEVLGRE